ncbi:MAG TPA: AarF/ABC1/UbiB kinase family protein [Acidobacteria bacterium]|nr:AarF/ABC1/UbiB kinase family protein [Acidobacteriota bacterium]
MVTRAGRLEGLGGVRAGRGRRGTGWPGRLGTTLRHGLGLAAGALVDSVRRRRQGHPPATGLSFTVARVAAAAVRPWLDPQLAAAPFPVQLRLRLEMLGPVYIKLGQVLSLRTDLLPEAVTSELRNLLDRLPAAPWEAIEPVIEADLGGPVQRFFRWVDPDPMGSASIAQIHRAVTRQGDDVVLKVVKPEIPGLLRQDAVLLRAAARLLDRVLPAYRPREIVEEFLESTRRELDMGREAANAETFAAAFEGFPGVVFPEVHRHCSGPRVLCLQWIDGIRPDSPEAASIPLAERRKLIDTGAAVIVQMLYRDGFFHADLHPANVLIVRREEGYGLAFLDLGMVGRLEARVRRLMLYYFYSVVQGDFENAARYLASVARRGPDADTAGFRKEMEDISRRWRGAETVREYSLAQLILQSIQSGARYRMYFPVEMVLMVRALVTYEGIGMLLDPGLNVARITRRHVTEQFRRQMNPFRLAREGLRRAPDLMDAIITLPTLVTEGMELLEQRREPAGRGLDPAARAIYGGSCLLAGAVLAAASAPWPAWALLLGAGIVLPLTGRRKK